IGTPTSTRPLPTSVTSQSGSPVNGNVAVRPTAANPWVAFDPAAADDGPDGGVGGVKGPVVVVGVVVVVVVVVAVVLVVPPLGGVSAPLGVVFVGGVTVPPPPPVVVVQSAEVPPCIPSMVTCAWMSLLLLRELGGVAVAIK